MEWGNTPTNSDTDIIAQIEKLSHLKEKGILGVEEFENKKLNYFSDYKILMRSTYKKILSALRPGRNNASGLFYFLKPY